jgi:Pyruvate/2-oxoacid:ferredoxin oxidoreductase gamma subunit
MPTNLSQSLVFLETGLGKLKQQEQTLKNHKHALLSRYRSNLGKQNEDEKVKNTLVSEIGVTTSKLLEIQKLKFGQQVDLVMLENLRVNQEADALRDEAKRVEAIQLAEMSAVTNEINGTTDEHTKEVQRNTALLGALASLTEQQRDIESVLQNSRTTQTADDLHQDLGLDNPKDLLAQIDQNNELLTKIEEEITLLKRK